MASFFVLITIRTTYWISMPRLGVLQRLAASFGSGCTVTFPARGCLAHRWDAPWQKFSLMRVLTFGLCAVGRFFGRQRGLFGCRAGASMKCWCAGRDPQGWAALGRLCWCRIIELLGRRHLIALLRFQFVVDQLFQPLRISTLCQLYFGERWIIWS